MKAKTLTPMGALHPILFFAGVYVVVLVFSVFICSALFYSCNSSPAKIGEDKNLPQEKTIVSNHSSGTSVSAVALR
jgi:hypothetical protein